MTVQMCAGPCGPGSWYPWRWRPQLHLFGPRKMSLAGESIHSITNFLRECGLYDSGTSSGGYFWRNFGVSHSPETRHCDLPRSRSSFACGESRPRRPPSPTFCCWLAPDEKAALGERFGRRGGWVRSGGGGRAALQLLPEVSWRRRSSSVHAFSPSRVRKPPCCERTVQQTFPAPVWETQPSRDR